MPLKASDLVPIEEIEFSDFELLVGLLKMRCTVSKNKDVLEWLKDK